VAEGEYTLSIGGGQPRAAAPFVAQAFQVKGSLTLPE
jgi:hypothetical protein